MNLNRMSTPSKYRNNEKDMEITSSAWIQPHLLDEGWFWKIPKEMPAFGELIKDLHQTNGQISPYFCILFCIFCILILILMHIFV